MLSIILNSYNRLEDLKKAVDSVFAQTYKDWELIICDDCSPDPGITSYLQDLTKHNEQVIPIYGGYYSPEEKQDDICTFGNLINIALGMSKGKYISYLIDDVRYSVNRCAMLVEYMEKNRGAFAVWDHQSTITLNSAGQVVKVDARKVRDIIIEHHKGPDFVRRLEGGNFINHCSVVHRKTDIRWSILPKHWKNIDQEFWLQCARAGHQFDFYPALIGETMYSSSKDIGAMLRAGKTVAEIVKARIGNE